MRGRVEVWTNESWVFCWRQRVTLLSWHWSGVHSTLEVLKQRRVATSLRRALFALSNDGTIKPARRVKCSCWGVWSDQCLEVGGCSLIDGLQGQHHRLESDAGCNRNPITLNPPWSPTLHCSLSTLSPSHSLASVTSISTSKAEFKLLQTDVRVFLLSPQLTEHVKQYAEVHSTKHIHMLSTVNLIHSYLMNTYKQPYCWHCCVFLSRQSFQIFK